MYCSPLLEYHEFSYSSDGPSYCHGKSYEACGYKEIKDLAFLDEFADYVYQRVKDAIHSSFLSGSFGLGGRSQPLFSFSEVLCSSIFMALLYK